MDFQNLMKIEFCWRVILKILIIHNPSLGSCEVPHKIWAQLAQSFDVYWMQTNKQTLDKQSK